jgi:hypothetical protein
MLKSNCTHVGRPVDSIPHSGTELIDRAAALGYDALAITLHEQQCDVRTLAPYAAERGIVLIPGVERTIEGCHVLLLNFRNGADEVKSFADLVRLKRATRGLVVAPHPFFPTPTCLGRQLERNADLFDAVEYNAMFTASVNFNRRAERWAPPSRHAARRELRCAPAAAARLDLFTRDAERDPRTRSAKPSLPGGCASKSSRWRGPKWRA